MQLVELILTLAFMGDAQITTFSPKEVTCLAQNIYHEARGESVAGQRAVAHVTLNRVDDPRWPDTICDVVYQDSQFSWTRKAPSVKDPVAYENATMVALNAMMGVSPDPTNGATFFYDHNTVTPRWSHVFDTVAVIGDHTFQR